MANILLNNLSLTVLEHLKCLECKIPQNDFIGLELSSEYIINEYGSMCLNLHVVQFHRRMSTNVRE
jgi:hypothetical protein